MLGRGRKGEALSIQTVTKFPRRFGCTEDKESGGCWEKSCQQLTPITFMVTCSSMTGVPGRANGVKGWAVTEGQEEDLDWVLGRQGRKLMALGCWEGWAES